VAVNASEDRGMNAQLHVLFGAGQVGRPSHSFCWMLASECGAAKRSPTGVPPGAEAIRGDAADRGFCAQGAEGAATVYN
jgi:hypothetical protein